MRNLATCYSEHAIRVSDSYCSGNTNKVHLSPTLIPSIQDEVQCLYKVKLSSQKQLFITLTWSTHNIDFSFTITIFENPNSNSKTFHLKKIKGSKKLEPLASKIELIWDLSNAVYEIGPEPVKGYYVVALVNAEVVLIGEIEEDLEMKKFVFDYPFAKSLLISRNEKFYGNGEYATKAKFFDTGTWHDITVNRVRDNDWRVKNGCLGLCVDIDKKNVINVKRLRWNFRGNQTMFLDGMLVDFMWDVHDWFFDSNSNLNSNSRSKSRVGIFLFRPRSGLDSRLWLEEKNLDEEEQEKMGSSLVIYACKNPC